MHVAVWPPFMTVTVAGLFSSQNMFPLLSIADGIGDMGGIRVNAEQFSSKESPSKFKSASSTNQLQVLDWPLCTSSISGKNIVGASLTEVTFTVNAVRLESRVSSDPSPRSLTFTARSNAPFQFSIPLPVQDRIPFNTLHPNSSPSNGGFSSENRSSSFGVSLSAA